MKKGHLINREKTFDNTPVITEYDILDDGKKKKRNRRKNAIENEDHIYFDYPIDIWFLISEYIQPEDVKTFSLICLKTNLVISTAKFWFYLYRKHYNRHIELPSRLQPGCMVRLGELKACTIRSLFYTYPSFVNRLSSLRNQDYQNLIKLPCIGVWYKQDGNDWLFYFKFKQRQLTDSRYAYVEENIKRKDVLQMATDIFLNAEDGCKILMVKFSVMKLKKM